MLPCPEAASNGSTEIADAWAVLCNPPAVGFASAYTVVHEMPDTARFFAEMAAALKPGGSLLLVEPAGHVKFAEFEIELPLAAQAGLKVVDRPRVRRSHSALLKKMSADS